MYPMKGKAKKEAFKKLIGEMMEDSVEDYSSMHEGMDAPMKATIMAEDEEGLIEGAKQLPKALSKAEEYMRKEIGMDSFDEAERQANKKKKK